MNSSHTFHIPVMGIGFTLDTPLRVAKYGINSVVSLNDDTLLEKLRKIHHSQNNIPYLEISAKEEDFRAKRITSYLNSLNTLIDKSYQDLKVNAQEKVEEIKEYLSLLPQKSKIVAEFQKLNDKISSTSSEYSSWVSENLFPGNIDVNIMTKVDKENFQNGEKLPIEFNDAHAAVRGFAESNVNSSMILSAGMSPRLYSYMEQFDDFYPNENGEIKKKIVLKVSDYRSAMIQGKFLAKKGLWVSEFRIESGLNCGGHAFATDGYLIGPILNEFKTKKQDLIDSLQAIVVQNLESKGKKIPLQPLCMKITAQGGVGTSEEHDFLMDEYQLNSVGWGSPFLLVPEATVVDAPTLEQLRAAKEKDLYLSHISPLGIPFNNLRGNSKDEEKKILIDKKRSGSSCPKKYLALNKEFGDKALCTASREYQYLKLKELEDKGLTDEQFNIQKNKIEEKACICVGLGTSVLLNNNLDTKREGTGVSICPGPNLAYFSKIMSLKDMVNHIYGRENVISRTDRPHVFIKELSIYLDYLSDQIDQSVVSFDKKTSKYLTVFSKNLKEGIHYYQDLFSNKLGLKQQFAQGEQALSLLNIKIEDLKKTLA